MSVYIRLKQTLLKRHTEDDAGGEKITLYNRGELKSTSACIKTSKLAGDELQLQKTTPGSIPVSQQQASEAMADTESLKLNHSRLEESHVFPVFSRPAWVRLDPQQPLDAHSFLLLC